MFISIKEGKAVVNEQGMAQPFVKKVYKNDKSKGKKSFESWMRFVFYSYSKESIYRNYLPEDRERHVVLALFPDKSVTHFKTIIGMKELISKYVDITYTFKEKLYRRLLQDIEEMMDAASKIPLVKTTRVKGAREITFFSRVEEQDVTELVDLDVRVTIDNTVEKLKAIDTLEKLLKREEILKKKLKEEEIEMAAQKKTERRMFDQSK